jgi:hypothetical protein
MTMTKHDLILATIAVSATFALACTSAPKEASLDSPSKTSQAAAEVGATHYTVINFAPGQNTLPEPERAKLRELASEAARHGKVAEIQVLAWADKEYPKEEQNVASRDEKLADQRAETIKDFLKKDLKTSADVEAHNMAKRPGVFSELVKSEGYEVKTSFENTGAAPNDVGPRASLTGNKASKAVVLIKYE